MNKVHVKLLIRFQSDKDNFHLKFSPNWSFSIDGFQFSFINEDQVQVSFEYEAELSERWADGQVAHRIPSEGDPEFKEKREELEKVLDLLSLSSGQGIKIQTGSATVSSQGIGSSNPVDNTKVVVLPDIEGITKRLEYVKKRNDKGLINGLRSYRMSLSYEDSGEKIAKLWGVIEQLYSQSGGKMFTDEELEKLRQLLSGWDVSPDYKRDIVIKRAKDTPAISPMESMVAKVKLMDEEGDFSPEEIRTILGEWRSARSSAAHGARGSNSEEVDDVLWDIEQTVEALIGNQVYPKMIRYLLFIESDINTEFLERQGFLVSKLKDGYCSYAIRFNDFEHYKTFLPNELTSNEASIYIVSHNEVHKLTKTSTQLVALEELEDPIKEFITTLQNKINDETE
jgi:hypothetical protein